MTDRGAPRTSYQPHGALGTARSKKRGLLRHWRLLPLSKTLPIMLAALLFSSVALIATVTTSALNTSLYGQLNTELSLATERARATDVAKGDAVVRPDDSVPPGLDVRTQRAHTIIVDLRAGTLRAGYIDDGETPTFHQLDSDQVAMLLKVPVDGGFYDVPLPDLGTYRAVAINDRTGARQVVAISQEAVANTIAQYMVVQMIVIALAGIGALLLGWRLMRRALHPLEVVARTAQSVAGRELATGDAALSERIPEVFVDDVTEVGRVAGSFNRMLTHIDDAFRVRRTSETKLRRFVADASHELRTPLASIRGYTQLVLRDADTLPPHAAEQLGRVRSESERMSDLVEDLLLLARLDNEPVIEREEVDLRGLLIDAVADAHAAGPNHHWQLDLDASRPLEVLGDENSLRQVLVNLLANSRTHTPAGTSVVLGAAIAGDDVRIEVRDDGQGIPAQMVDTIFDRFVKADDSRTPGQGSTGLGLSIVQALVHAHGGSVTVASTPQRFDDDGRPIDGDHGTTFTVLLPRLRHPQQDDGAGAHDADDASHDQG
ncbi:sensor histidine kinase [Pseudoclavibacter sp. 13-3]|uniref:sensor histidine kinase n=1 Tax=Pseudoclavibacter sp. 13-3 TaxID=2901228 RepID=UPI001E4C4C22|nr:HAMP domain-containing sensor histidine kinase [Pseudoclavibacter sp. 13-3]MCD7100793.1 HAMP domain-containing histidine kinase [Pseudoclavibacter sp. 13-3]